MDLNGIRGKGLGLVLVSCLFQASTSHSRSVFTGTASSDWNKAYNTGYSKAKIIHINLRVADMNAALNLLETKVRKHGADSGRSNYGHGAGVEQRAYEVKVVDLAGFTKDIVQIGELQSYQTQEALTQASLDEITDKINRLEKELEAGKNHWGELPIAREFLQAKLDQLRQAEKTHRDGIGGAQVIVNLSLPPEQMKKP